MNTMDAYNIVERVENRGRAVVTADTNIDLVRNVAMHRGTPLKVTKKDYEYLVELDRGDN